MLAMVQKYQGCNEYGEAEGTRLLCVQSIPKQFQESASIKTVS
jgi:hypothetical protein